MCGRDGSENPDPPAPVYKLGVAGHTGNPSLGITQTGGPPGFVGWPVSPNQSSSFSDRLCLKKKKVESD